MVKVKMEKQIMENPIGLFF